MPPNTVYVGRGSDWGNPYRVRYVGGLWRVSGPWFDGIVQGEVSGRADAMGNAVRYFRHLIEMDGLYAHCLRNAAQRYLSGKNLCCWCPLVDANGNKVPCHASILLEIANG